MTLGERAERSLGLECAGYVSRRALVGFDEPGCAPALRYEDLDTQGPRVLLCSRVAVDRQELPAASGRTRLTLDGQTVGWLLSDGVATPQEEVLRQPTDDTSGDSFEVRGVILDRPWDLLEGNPARIAADVDDLWPDDSDVPQVLRFGDHRLSVHQTGQIEPGVHVDLRHGPIRIAAGARVEGPARLTGPLFVGPDSTVFGGSVGTSTIGPVCLVRGEVAHSILTGFVNKAHDGYLGHAIVGRWVNLGAFTTNSDLKNNYGAVRVWTLDGECDTGLVKVGCFLGDHVKTGIGTVLTTGTVVGAGSNIFGGLMPPTVVPPFSWGSGPDLRDHRLEKFLQTTQRVMARRSQALTPGVESILRRAWRDTAGRRAE
jgi:UDP-N-acetylglucosamine diphosphorylase/glucosamine-1-phosphate N-acetyltransferase